MPSSILQTPLWLQAEQDLRNQLLTFNDADTKSSNETSISLAETTLGRHEAEFSQKGIKAAAQLGPGRHLFTVVFVALLSSVAIIGF